MQNGVRTWVPVQQITEPHSVFSSGGEDDGDDEGDGDSDEGDGDDDDGDGDDNDEDDGKTSLKGCGQDLVR